MCNQFKSIQFNSNFIIPQEINMWCMTLKTENTSTLQDTNTFSKRQINQTIQDAVLKVTIKKNM